MTQANPFSAYAATRDAEAFAQVVEQYQRLVFATCRRKLHDPADLDDAVQETFLKLAQKAGELKSNVGGWLHRCAVNVAIDINRRRSRQQRYEAEAAKNHTEGIDDPQQMLTDLREQLDAAMEKLDPEQRELIIQRYFVGRAQVEMAAEAGVSPSTITHRLERAIDGLRAHLERLGTSNLASAGGVAVLGGLLEAEHASAAVPAQLTANLMKIGLSGVPKAAAAAGAGAAAGTAMSLGAIIASVAAAVLVAGATIGLSVWIFLGKPSNTNITIAQSPSPAPGANTVRTAAGVAGQPPPAPQWQTTTQPAAARRAVLSGRVLDRAGKPVVGATLTLQGPGAAQVKSDPEGNYLFPTIRADGEYRIGVEADGYLSIDPWSSNMPGVQLTKQSEARRDLVLDRGVTVIVAVKDIAGQPLRGVRIDADNSDDHRSSSRSQSTDPSGMLTFVLPATKQAYQVAGVIDGYAPAHATITPSSVDQPLEVELTMTKGMSVSGIAICKDGKPATGWSIEAYPDWWTSYYVPKGAKIDGEGKFTLTDISPGQYRLNLSIPTGEGSSMSEQITTVSLPPAEKDQPLRLTIPRASPGTLSRLVGKVKFVGGKPDYVSIQATGASDQRWYNGNVEIGRTRRGNTRLAPDEGQFTIESMPAGEYRLQFESPSIEAKVLEHVKVPGELPTVELHVIGKPHLTGTVIDSATGNPIPHFAVRARKIRTVGQGANYTQEARWIQVSNPDGKFDIELVGPGVYQVQASVDGYAWLWSAEATVQNGKADVTLKLNRGGALSGVVVDSDGKPVEGAKVIPLSMAKSVAMGYAERFGGDAGAVMTDSQGRFTLPHLTGGIETIKVVHPSFAPTLAANLKITDGSTSDAGTVKLAFGGIVEGIIYDAQGNPTPGVTLQFQDESGYGGNDDEEAGRVAVATSDDKGLFRVEHLPGQVLWVNTSERWNRMGVVRRAVHPVDGKTARLDFGGAAPIKGRFLKDGQPVPAQRVELSVESPHFGVVMVNGTTDSEGRFTFFGPPMGRYTLFAMTDTRLGQWVRARDVDFLGQPVDLGDVEAEVGEVVITVEADSPDDLKSITQVSISTDVKGKPWQDHVALAAPDPATPNTWRAANVPTGHYRVSLYAKGDGDSGTSYTVPFERPAKTASTPVRAHIPHASAVLSVSLLNPAAGEDGARQWASVRSEDDSVQISLSAGKDPGKPITVKVPAATYRVMDPSAMQPHTDIPPVTLKDGETRDLKIDLQAPVSSKVVLVQIRLWDPTGVPVFGITPKLFAADGTAYEPGSDSGLGMVFNVPPGHYRLDLERPGNAKISREIDAAQLAPNSRQRWTPIDIFIE